MSATIGSRRANLEKANRIYRARAELRRRIASGEISAASVIRDPSAETEGWAIGKILATQPRWGDMRVRRLLGRVSPYTFLERKPLRELTERQRHLIAIQLEEVV